MVDLGSSTPAKPFISDWLFNVWQSHDNFGTNPKFATQRKRKQIKYNRNW